MSSDATSVGHRIAKAMFVVVVFWVFWKFGGFLMNVVIGRMYGDNPVAKDAYGFVYKWMIFAIIYPSFLKIVLPAGMPLFIEVMDREGEERAWDFANTIANLVVILSVVMLCLGMIFSRQIVGVLAARFDDRTKDLVADMLRIMFPGIFAANLCVVALMLQNAYKIFAFPPAGDALQKIVWAVLVFVGAKFLGWDERAIAYGFLLGCVPQLLANVVGLRRKLHFYRPTLPMLSMSRAGLEIAIAGVFVAAAFVYRWALPSCSDALARMGLEPEFALFSGVLFIGALYSLMLWLRVKERGSYLARFVALAAPLLISILFARWRDLSTSYFQTFTGKQGWFGNLEFAKTIGNLPHIMLSQTLAIAMLPYLCDLATKRDWKTFGSVLTGTLKLLALVFVPMTIVVSVLALPIIQVVYDDGGWSNVDLAITCIGLRFFIWGLLFFAIENALMQSFFSAQKVWWPTSLGIAAAFVHTGLLVGLINWFGFNYPFEIYVIVAASLPASRAIKNTALLVVTRFRVSILPWKETCSFLVRLCVLSVGVWAGTHYSYRYMRSVLPVQPLKTRQAMIDTFNMETKEWFSRDADSVTIAPHTDAPAPLGDQSLRVEYRSVARRPVVIERNMGYAALSRGKGLEMWMRTDRQVQLSLLCVDGPSRTAERTIELRPNRWMRVELWFQDKPGSQQPKALVGNRFLSIRETDGSRPSEKTDTALQIDALSLIRNDGLRAVVDDFEKSGAGWRAAASTRWEVGPITEGEDERALHVLSGPVGLGRDVSSFELGHADELSMKTKSSREGRLRVALVNGSGARYTAELNIPRSDDRMKRRLALAKLKDSAGKPLPSAADIVRLELADAAASAAAVADAEPWDLWIDNIAFGRSRTFRDRIVFEAYKLAHVLVPGLAAGVIFILGIVALRIEEGKTIFDWFKSHGWDKLMSKLSRKRDG